MTTELERDLDRRIRERIFNAVRDGLALYEMAELDREKAAVVVAHELLRAFAAIVAAAEDDNPPPQKITDMIGKMIEVARRRRRERKMCDA